MITAFGITAISRWIEGYSTSLKVGGGLMLIGFGLHIFRADVALLRDAEGAPVRDKAGSALTRTILSTFALTITNPITILAFLAIFAGIGFTGEQATLGAAAVLVLGVWVGSLLWWAGLSAGAGMVRLSFRHNHLVWINRGSGGILILSGVGLLGSLLFEH